MKWLLAILVISILNGKHPALCRLRTHGSQAYKAEENPKLLQNLRFHSSNFESILEWGNSQESSPGIVYSVLYKRYGEVKWNSNNECQNITQTSCNLTYEIRDTEEQYFAKVIASNQSHGDILEERQTPRFSACRDTLIKSPLVTCIPSVRSVKFIVHPSPTALWTSDGHQQTLEEIFPDLFYSLQLHINQTYQMHSEGKKKEYEFFGLAPDTDYQGVTLIVIPNPLKESAPYTCRVRTLTDVKTEASDTCQNPTWMYAFSGMSLFTMGFLVAVLCYLSYRYIKKPPKQPNSLDVQRVLTFQPLRFIQEHILIPAIDFGSSGGLVPPIQYSQAKIPRDRESLGAPLPPGLPEITYLGQSEISIPFLLAHQAPPPLSYAPQSIPEVGPPSYAPQVVSKTEASSYAPQPPTDPWPPSYGTCLEDSGGEMSPQQELNLRCFNGTMGQPQPKQIPAGPLVPNSQTEALQKISRGNEFFHQLPGLQRERPPSPALSLVHPTGSLESIATGYLSNQTSLLSSVQVEDHPFPFPSSTSSLLLQPREVGTWGLLNSVVCPKNDPPPGPERGCLAQSTELDLLFRDLDLTVQWES